MMKMKDISIGESLEGGVEVIGLVEFMKSGYPETLEKEREKEGEMEYHLLTNVGYFFLDGKIEKDFNLCVEKYL
jgi:hypothetical protein